MGESLENASWDSKGNTARPKVIESRWLVAGLDGVCTLVPYYLSCLL
jgi:hypothetical protein